MKSSIWKVMLLTVLLVGYSCSSDSEDDVTPVSNPDPDPDPTKLTYTKDVKSILTQNCTGCHGSPLTNNAPFELLTYAQVNEQASKIIDRISKQNGETGIMPPNGRLPQNTIDIIDKWIKDGKLE